MDEMSQPRRDDRPARHPHTHTVWAYQRTGRKSGRMLDCGTGYIDRDKNIAHVVSNRQPLGGFTGYIMLVPTGTQPQPMKMQEVDEEDSEG